MEQQSLFEDKKNQPLASRLRPQTLDEFVGQTHLLGEGKILRKLIEGDNITSIIFWGNPGIGKTTLARIIANKTNSEFIDFSAVTSGIKEIKRGGRRAYGSRRADKAPRENEAQLLPALEIQNAVIPENLKEPMQQAQAYIADILAHMGIKVENLHTWWDEKQNRILITLDCDKPAIVIGKEGKTLESLQYLTTLSISRHFAKPISVVVDTQNYWRKAEDKINADLEYGINQIKKGYSVYRFRPMSAQLRRYIHRAAENNEFVITVSEGEGEWRKVTLRPRPADQPVAKAAEAIVAEPVVVETIEKTVVETPATVVETVTQTTVIETVAEQPAQTPAETAPVADVQPAPQTTVQNTENK